MLKNEKLHVECTACGNETFDLLKLDLVNEIYEYECCVCKKRWRAKIEEIKNKE